MLMSAADYRESLRRYRPRVFVNGRQIGCVADEPALRPGVNALGVTYDYALNPTHRHLALADNHDGSGQVNRFISLNRSTEDLQAKLELTRLVCQETGCAMRYLSMDGLNALYQLSHRLDDATGSEYRPRVKAYLEEVQSKDLTVGIAMTDAKGDRRLRPHEQPRMDSYLHVTERRADGVVISGVKAIVTAGPCVHELLVLPGRAMTPEDAPFAIACAVPVDAPGLTMIARPAGRPGEDTALFSGHYGQTTAVCVFEDVFVPWERVFLCGEHEHSEFLTKSYATHHRHTCIAARAGFGDLLIGAGVLMLESNGLDAARNTHLRDTMVELIKIVEGFYACGVAASVYGYADPAGILEPDAVFSNIGKLLLSNQIYDMYRLAHEVSGGLIVALPGPDEDHNPHTAASLAEIFRGSPDVPADRRVQTARFIEDLTASDAGGWMSLISLHGGGSPQALKAEIYRRYPVQDKRQLVERLIERGLSSAQPSASREPGQCCDRGCSDPAAPPAAAG
ncbi:MAG: 4-hydroxyphenylacetate 3-hydroxylase family protein [Gammaproteobacteria bacterium]|jgi:4-hydroxybutyryl-CoA dehydratase/vinylacetyl-CoA-Delta-isomerase